MRVTEKDLRFTLAQTKRQVFNDTFPGGAKVTLENARMATRAGLSLRCAAEQLMDGLQLARFKMSATRLLVAYLKATAETRRTLKSLHFEPGNKAAWLLADIAHRENKEGHWAMYLEELAQAFVEAIDEAVSSPSAANTP